MIAALRRHAALIAVCAAGTAFGVAAFRFAWPTGLVYPLLFGAVVGLTAYACALRRQLAATRRRFDDLAMASGDWLWEMGPDLRFTFISERYRESTGQDPAELIGRSRQELGAGGDDPAWQSHLEVLRKHRPFRDFVYSHRMPDRQRRVFRTSGVPVHDDQGGFRGYRGVASEITTLVAMEERARRLEAELAEAHRLETAGVFAGQLAHDLNNALVPILTVIRALMRRLADQPRELEDLALAFEAAQRCKEMVAQVLVMVQRERRSDVALDLKAPVADAIALARRTLPGHVTLGVEVEPTPMPVVAAPTKIVQIVTGLLAHALRGRGEGCTALRLRVAAVDHEWFTVTVDEAGGGAAAPAREWRLPWNFLELSAIGAMVRELGGDLQGDPAAAVGFHVTVRLPRAGGTPSRDQPGAALAGAAV